MKEFLLIIVYMSLQIHAFPQDEKNNIATELKKLAETYNNSGSLSFNISFYYADEQSPRSYLDSLKGTFKILGNNFWYDLDETEAMSGKDYMVMLFKEDRIMYLVKPTAVNKTLNPIALLDSLFINNKDIQASIAEGKEEKKIAFHFLPGLKYKTIEYYIDQKTGLINRIISVIQSKELYDPESRDEMDTSASYSVVEVIFSQYQKGVSVTRDFDAGRYFKKTGDEFLPVSPYESYKIFLGSPNL